MATLIIWAAIIAALVGGIIWLYTAGRSAGKAGIAADVASKTADVTQKQAQAQADAPRSKDAIIDRLREGGGL
jgi:hypothetical protein